MDLSSMVMLKDNHIWSSGRIECPRFRVLRSLVNMDNMYIQDLLRRP